MWDVFISHAWEDKEDIARPLAKALRRAGLRVWYDEFTLTAGDRLSRSIDHGLAQSRYGIVILSPNFFSKEWPQRELNSFVAREVSSGKTILPIWHNVTWEDVRRFSPTLADKVAVSTTKGMDAVVKEILQVVRVDLKSESTEEELRSRPRSVAKRTLAKPQRPTNLQKVGAIAGVLAVLIALGAWLVPNTADLLSTWLLPPKPIPLTVALLTCHGRYITAMDGEYEQSWVLRAETTELKDWEKFTLLCLDNGKVALETHDGRYVTAMNDEEDWVLRAETKTLSAWEEFTLVEAETGEELPCLEAFELLGQGSVRIALKTHDGKYVTAMNDEDNRDWVLRAETETLSDWETFTVIPQQ